RDLVAAAAGGLERETRDALDLVPLVDHRREALVGAVVGRLAEVDPARELAEDHHVGAAGPLGPQGREALEAREHRHRPEVREDAQVAPEGEDRGLDPLLARQAVPRVVADGPAHGAEQHGVGPGDGRARLVGEGGAVLLERAAAERQAAVLEVEAEARGHGLEGRERRLDDLGADEVPGQHGDDLPAARGHEGTSCPSASAVARTCGSPSSSSARGSYVPVIRAVLALSGMAAAYTPPPSPAR